MRFQIMIAMNVFSIMHWIVGGIKTIGFAMRGFVLKIRYYINVLLWTQVILDESLLALWKTMNFFFHVCIKK
jgi:hypothetical protein